MNVTALPPFLVIRAGTSFWRHDSAAESASCTLDAWEENVYEGTVFYDGAGGRRETAAAELLEEPMEMAPPDQRLAVKLEFAPRESVALDDVVAAVREVLNSGSEFVDHVGAPVAEMHRRLDGVRDFAGLMAALESAFE